MKHHPAAFINAIAEEGTKDEAIKYLQETWNELCEIRNKVVTDYHNFTWRTCGKAWRKRFDVGDIYINAAICTLCGWFIRSRNRHDYVTCQCGALSVDGGSWYAKRTGNPENYTDVIELFEEV